MSDIICITNRVLCTENFLERIEKIAAAHPAAIVLREKDLSAGDYKNLAKSVVEICKRHNVPYILHSFPDVAKSLEVRAVHLPMHALRALTATERGYFTTLGASCHSVEDALDAERLGCTYITAGHVFDTDCKRGAPGRGLEFLKNVTAAVTIPVYAIGGITHENYPKVIAAGAKGVCVMSGAMTCAEVGKYFDNFKVQNEI